MTIYMTSDLHVDHWFKTNQRNEDVKALSEACLDASYHYINHRVSLENYINNALKPADVLCVAGDTCDNPHLFVEFYKAVSPRYKKIFVVFGNHDLTVHNESYFRNNTFTETQAKLDFLKAEVSKLGNVSILDGTVEEFEGVKFGGTMAFNDFSWAYKVEPEPEGDMAKFLRYWKRWFDYRNWEYMGNVHKDILTSQMKKLDHVVSQKPDIILTHYIPLFFGVEKIYEDDVYTTFFYFNGQKYLDQLKDKSIWLAGHTHSVRTNNLAQSDGRIIHLKLNPVGYPDEDTGNAERMDEFLIKQ